MDDSTFLSFRGLRTPHFFGVLCPATTLDLCFHRSDLAELQMAGRFIGLPWVYHGFTMGLPWVYHGFTMGLPHHHITIYHLPFWELKQTTLLDTNGLGCVGLACGRVPLVVFDLNHGRIISSFSFNPKKHETPTWDSLVLFKRYLRSRDRKDHDGR